MTNTYPMLKYPRTPHIEGSRLQPGDEDLSQIPFAQIAGRPVVVEEKCDGANTAISFGTDGSLLLQSRGHYLRGGEREKHYDLFKRWATVQRQMLYGLLGCRYILYGEWLYAKHSVYYDALPHYFMEFDIWDRETACYLDTPTRHTMLQGLPILSAPVLAARPFATLEALTALLGPSAFIRAGHIDRLRAYCTAHGEDAQARCAETDPSATMEGLYIKVEATGRVLERMKFVRPSFLQCVAQSETHWLSRPIIPNGLVGSLDALLTPFTPTEGAPMPHA